MTAEWSPLWLSLRVALLVSVLTLAAAPWPAWLLARRNWPAVSLITGFLAMVPAVILAALAIPSLPWQAAAAAGLVRTVPHSLEACRGAFQSLPPGYLKAARMAGAADWRVFWTLALPLRGWTVLAAAANGFPETLLEMAVVFWMRGRLAAAPAGAILLTALAGAALSLWLKRAAAGPGWKAVP